MLLERAAEDAQLSPAERDACRTLADDLDLERPESVAIRTPPSAAPRPAHPQGAGRGRTNAKASTATLADRQPGRSRHLHPVPDLLRHTVKLERSPERAKYAA